MLWFLRSIRLYVQFLQFNQQVPRNPASVMKLLTTFGVLDMLGPDYTWRTEAYVRGTLKNGRLQGDLILKGYGDPYVTPEAFWKFLRGLRTRGLEKIVGDVILDGSFLEKPAQQRGDFGGRPQSKYTRTSKIAVSLCFLSPVICGVMPKKRDHLL